MMFQKLDMNEKMTENSRRKILKLSFQEELKKEVIKPQPIIPDKTRYTFQNNFFCSVIHQNISLTTDFHLRDISYHCYHTNCYSKTFMVLFFCVAE